MVHIIMYLKQATFQELIMLHIFCVTTHGIRNVLSQIKRFISTLTLILP